MISVAQALDALFALAPVLPAQAVPIRHASGRVLASDVTATRDQPPFAASAMDGYAVGGARPDVDDTFTVIGEAAAGQGFAGSVGPAQAVRIFTGAPLPDGSTRVIIQENVARQGDQFTVTAMPSDATFIRPAGGDFKCGDSVLAPRLLGPSDIAHLASMGAATVSVTRKPVVAIISTGDELVQPGEVPSGDQIIASNSYGLAALIESIGAEARLLPIARDTLSSLALAFDLAKGADLILTIGGASVGDHDLVAKAAADHGLDQSFYKVAMRPGKPLMAGRMGTAMMIGLPGNPVSSMVCGQIFVLPVLRKMLGLPAGPAPRTKAKLTHSLRPNGAREHYMRAHLEDGQVTVFDRQDSALLSVLAQANCLAVRAPDDGSRLTGDRLDIIKI